MAIRISPQEPKKRRQIRGLATVSIGSCIKLINKLQYKVRSQSVGHYQWLRNLMDDTTRFWVSTMVGFKQTLSLKLVFIR